MLRTRIITDINQRAMHHCRCRHSGGDTGRDVMTSDISVTVSTVAATQREMLWHQTHVSASLSAQWRRHRERCYDIRLKGQLIWRMAHVKMKSMMMTIMISSRTTMAIHCFRSTIYTHIHITTFTTPPLQRWLFFGTASKLTPFPDHFLPSSFRYLQWLELELESTLI